ncbi:FecR family protein [Negadavirga shengliensis]|uniref:FecR family protein n=1 Tax=Negadavirga shengliensis TaxID=1389218 RepID=A0ABV9SVM0_9BACT
MKKKKNIFHDFPDDKGLFKKVGFRHVPISETLKAREKERLFSEINIREGDRQTEKDQRWMIAKVWRVAAVLAVGMLLGFLAFSYESSFDTTYGQIGKEILPDGSKVTLNSNSTLSYSPLKWYVLKSREVSLEGEAFFEVKKYRVNGQPVKFQVKAGELTVQVLGTAFNVSNLREMESVTLQEGKVAVKIPSKEESVTMNPGERVEYHPASGQFSLQIVDPESYISWKDRYILLDNMTLGELAQIIERTYGKKVVFADEADKEIALEGKVPSDELTVLIRALHLVTGLDIRVSGNQVIIRKQKDNSQI